MWNRFVTRDIILSYNADSSFFPGTWSGCWPRYIRFHGVFFFPSLPGTITSRVDADRHAGDVNNMEWMKMS